jgi:(S)-sulfolactate dehydrogenase
LRIVVTEFMDAGAVASLAAAHDTRYLPDLVDRPDALAAEAAGADALVVRNRTQVRGALLEARASCAWSEGSAWGLDNIDVQACEARGIAVIPGHRRQCAGGRRIRDRFRDAALRGAFRSTGEVAAGRWPRTAPRRAARSPARRWASSIRRHRPPCGADGPRARHARDRA